MKSTPGSPETNWISYITRLNRAAAALVPPTDDKSCACYGCARLTSGLADLSGDIPIPAVADVSYSPRDASFSFTALMCGTDVLSRVYRCC